MNSSIKITSGKFRGRSIKTPGSSMTHPMGNREKLALFNMISEYLPGSRILDAFAGSGALGIEAISRGASEVVFVEKNAKVCKVIQDNLKDLGVKADIFRGDVLTFVSNDVFDVVLADPPYDKFDIEAVQYLSRFVKDGGVLVLSHPDEGPELPGLSLIKSKKYAAAHLSVYAKK